MKLLKNILIVSALGFTLSACNSSAQPEESNQEPSTNTTIITPAPEPKADPESKIKINIGKDKDGNVSGGLDAEVD